MDKLALCRKEIDEIDDSLTKLIEKRMEIVLDIAEYKKINKLPITNQNRETEVINKNLALVNNEALKPYIKNFYQSIFLMTKDYQRALNNDYTVGYQGIRGSFSEEAITSIFPKSNYQAFETFEDVYKAIYNNEIEYGVIPYENSTTGEVNEVIDLLNKYNLYITKIYDLKVSQNLLGVKGASLDTIKVISSHPQALKQCSNFIKENNYSIEENLNTAIACREVSEKNDKSLGAIGSINASNAYNLEVIAKDINDSKENTTRFMVISKNMNPSGEVLEISFILKNEVGSLGKVISLISKYGINMEHITSYSIKDLPWKYSFHIKLLADYSLDNTKALITELQKETLELKILGNY